MGPEQPSNLDLSNIPDLIRRLDAKPASPDKITMADLPDDPCLAGQIQGHREFPDNPRGQELVVKSYTKQINPSEQDELATLYEAKRAGR